MGGLGGKAGGRGTINVVIEEAASATEVVVSGVALASVVVGVEAATNGVGVAVVDDVLLMVKASSPTLLLESLASLLFPSLSFCCSCRGWSMVIDISVVVVLMLEAMVASTEAVDVGAVVVLLLVIESPLTDRHQQPSQFSFLI